MFFKRANAVIASSYIAKDYYVEHYRLSRDRIHVVPNVVDTKAVFETRKQLQAKLPSPKN